MNTNNFNWIAGLWEGDDVLIKCEGDILFEDFQHKIKAMIIFENFMKEVYEAVNDFKNIENSNILRAAIFDQSYARHVNDILFSLNFQLYIPGHFVPFLLDNLNKFAESSISSNIKVMAVNAGTEIELLGFEKIKTDVRTEVQCTGKLFFQTSQECLVHYEYLAFKLANSFFKYPNASSPDIFITDSNSLHLRGHCFLPESEIDKNIILIKKIVQQSIHAYVLIKTADKQNLFKKEQDWSSIKSIKRPTPLNNY